MGPEKPLVYIILLNYNGAEDTVDCLKSLQHVAYSNMRVVVVDNASTDDSASVLSDIQENYGFVFLRSKVNNGFSAGNNMGIRYAMDNKAQYVLLLNNDTVVEPDFLSTAIDASEQDPSVGLTIGKILFYKKPNPIWYGGGVLKQPYNYAVHLGYMEARDDPAFNEPRYVTYATGCYFLLKRETIQKVGLMDEDYFLYCEDTDYSIQILRSGYKILYCPQSVIYHKISASAGKGSPLSTYYIARNSVILYHRFFTGWERRIGMLYWFYKMMRSVLKGNRDMQAFLRGIKAGRRGETGKATL